MNKYMCWSMTRGVARVNETCVGSDVADTAMGWTVVGVPGPPE